MYFLLERIWLIGWLKECLYLSYYKIQTILLDNIAAIIF